MKKRLAYLSKRVMRTLTRVVSAHSAQLLLLQLAGAFSVLYGVSWYSVPAALILGGVAAIFAVQSHPDKD